MPPPGDFVRADSSRQMRAKVQRSKGVSKGAVSTDVPAWGGVNLEPKEGSGETSRGVNGLRCGDHKLF